MSSLRALDLSRRGGALAGGRGQGRRTMAFILTLDAAPPPGRLGRGTKGDVLDRASFLDRASSVRLAFGFGASRGFVVVGLVVSLLRRLCCIVQGFLRPIHLSPVTRCDQDD